MSPPIQEGGPERDGQNEIAIIEMDAEPDPSLPRAIILDLSPVNFLDTVAVKTLRSVRSMTRAFTHLHMQRDEGKYSIRLRIVLLAYVHKEVVLILCLNIHLLSTFLLV